MDTSPQISLIYNKEHVYRGVYLTFQLILYLVQNTVVFTDVLGLFLVFYLSHVSLSLLTPETG